jgi:hypothetical protein
VYHRVNLLCNPRVNRQANHRCSHQASLLQFRAASQVAVHHFYHRCSLQGNQR